MEIQLNLDKICRLCLEEKSEELQDVFGSESNLCENILHATTVKVEQGDGLPTHVCQQCVSLVNVIINFQRKCVVADLALHHYIKKCNSHKDHKECEAVKFYPRDPLQLTQIIKTEGGPCQIKSETSVFQFQEGREEVITGIIEEAPSNPRASVKPEEAQSSIRASKTVKGKQTNVRCISVNTGQNAAEKVHKRRRRKGHRWKIKKQSSVNRKRALGVHLQSTDPLKICTAELSVQNHQVPQSINSFPASEKLIMGKPGVNRIVCSFIAAEEGLPNTASSSTTAIKGYVLKKRKSGNSNSVVASKNILPKEVMQKKTVSSVTATVTSSQNPAEESPQNKRTSQNSNIVTANEKTLEQNLQNRTASQGSKTITANNNTTEQYLQNKRGSQSSNLAIRNKKTALKECQLNRRTSDASKTFLANKRSLVEEAASNQSASQKLVTKEHIQVQKRNSFSRKPLIQDSHPVANGNPEMEAYIQTGRVRSPTRNLPRKKPALEEPMPIQQSCSSVQANQKLEIEEYMKLQAENSSNKKPVTASDEKLPQSSKSASASQKLVAEDQIQRVTPMMKALKSKRVTEESVLNRNVLIPANEKLVADKHLRIQRVSTMKKFLKQKSVTETSTLTGNMTTPATEKLVPELMRNSVLEKQVTAESVSSQKVAPNINLLDDYKLVTEPHVRIQKVLPSRTSFINNPIMEKSRLNQSTPQSRKSVTANQKLMVKEHAQTPRVVLNRNILRRKSVMGECLQKDSSPETARNPALLPSSGTFQADEGCKDTISASEKHLESNNISTKRKTPETESSAPEPLSAKKQKSQENDRLTKLVIQVEGDKLCCSQCDSWFNDVEKLKRHLEELHNKRVIRWHTVTGPGPEKDAAPSLLCATCGKQFTSQRLFTLHHNQKSCL